MGADWIALSIAIAAHLHSGIILRVFSVRKSAKQHGRLKRIEGNFSAGDSVAVIEDVITTGGSAIEAIDAIETAGGRVGFVIALVDREEGGRENIEKRGYPVFSMFNRADLTAPRLE
jgi:orotate phosphoribosyltransferase